MGNRFLKLRNVQDVKRQRVSYFVRAIDGAMVPSEASRGKGESPAQGAEDKSL